MFICFAEMAFEDAAGRSVDFRFVSRRLQPGGAAAVRGRSLLAHHAADGLPQLSECPLRLLIFSHNCFSFPVIKNH